MTEERPDSFLIRCKRTLPMMEGRFRAPAFIKTRDFASVVPCRACDGRLVRTPPSTPRPENDFFYVCVKCGRTWLIESGGNPDTIVLRVSPAYELEWGWPGQRRTTDEAYQDHKIRILALGHQPADQKEWTEAHP